MSGIEYEAVGPIDIGRGTRDGRQVTVIRSRCRFESALAFILSVLLAGAGYWLWSRSGCVSAACWVLGGLFLFGALGFLWRQDRLVIHGEGGTYLQCRLFKRVKECQFAGADIGFVNVERSDDGEEGYALTLSVGHKRLLVGVDNDLSAIRTAAQRVADLLGERVVECLPPEPVPVSNSLFADMGPDPDKLQEACVLAAREGNVERAGELFVEAVKAYLQRHRYRQALESCEKVAEIGAALDWKAFMSVAEVYRRHEVPTNALTGDEAGDELEDIRLYCNGLGFAFVRAFQLAPETERVRLAKRAVEIGNALGKRFRAKTGDTYTTLGQNLGKEADAHFCHVGGCFELWLQEGAAGPLLG